MRLECYGCRLTCRTQQSLHAHMRDCERLQPRHRALHVIERERRRHQAAQARKRPREELEEGAELEVDTGLDDSLQARVIPPLQPLRNLLLDPYAAFGNRRTWAFFKYILHDGGFSHKKARIANIAHELVNTSSIPDALILEPAKGLAHGYSILDRLSEELGLNFIEHVIPITVGASACMQRTSNALHAPFTHPMCFVMCADSGKGARAVEFNATVHLRRILPLCRLLFGRCLPEHCEPKVDYNQDGDRVVSDCYSGLWAEQHMRHIRRIDPHGLLFAVDVAWDKSSLSKVQSAYPLYLKANAWPLEEQNKHRGRLLACV